MYRFVEHTAELELELEAGSAQGVFEEALLAFAELAGRGTGEPIDRSIDLEAGDLAVLLASWLDELVYLADVDGFLPDAAEVVLEGTRLRGSVRGRRGTPRPLVKGVTLHRLRLRPENGVWRGRVVLDV